MLCANLRIYSNLQITTNVRCVIFAAIRSIRIICRLGLHIIEPPAFSIATRAEAETAHPLKFNFLSVSPPIILTGGKRGPRARITIFSFNAVGVISAPSEKIFATTESETGIASFRDGFTVRPRFFPYPRRFGSFFMMSRISGRILWPARAVCPLPPRPDCLPRVEDCPRPILRYDRFRDFGRLMWFSCIYLEKLQAPSSKSQTSSSIRDTNKCIVFNTGIWNLFGTCHI